MTMQETLVDEHAAQIAKMQAAVEAATAVTVEIGPGAWPIFQWARCPQTFDADNLYIGVNIDSRQHKSLADKLKITGGFAVLNELENGVMPPLPLLDKSVSMVYIGNMLGEPDDSGIMRRFRYYDNVYHGHSSMRAKQRTLQEAGRLLSTEGSLVIVETITPYGDGPEACTELLSANGFAVTEVVTSADDAWEQATTPFAMTRGVGYLVTARPIEGEF